MMTVGRLAIVLLCLQVLPYGAVAQNAAAGASATSTASSPPPSSGSSSYATAIAQALSSGNAQAAATAIAAAQSAGQTSAYAAAFAQVWRGAAPHSIRLPAVLTKHIAKDNPAVFALRTRVLVCRPSLQGLRHQPSHKPSLLQANPTALQLQPQPLQQQALMGQWLPLPHLLHLLQQMQWPMQCPLVSTMMQLLACML